MSRKLEGKIAVVTGGSSGIGFATAKRFIDEGAFVYILGRRQVELEAAACELGPQAVGVQGDVTNGADLDRLIAQIEKEKGRIDVLFANAGAVEARTVDEFDEAHFDKLFGINVKGLISTVKKALPLMPIGSTIVLNGSAASAIGMPANGVYSATKAAIRSLVRSWTLELKDRGIRVNVVSPGPIVTPMMESVAGSLDSERAQSLKALVPLGRFGEPDEIAKAVVFLASDDSSYVAGVELFVDGGAAQV